ncbi:MAG TPA: HsdR family type I site-specific deoxyribonuclease [bacterium]|nr:HsdR family type I site-specific deoxyribonuclease [bacterium]
MPYTEAGTVENFIIQELQKLGWKYITPEEMNAKREEKFEELIVVEDLRNALRKINPGIELTDADLDFIIVSLRTTPTNLEGIKRFLDIFRNGLVIPLQKERKERVIKLIDFENIENNHFIVTNQFKVEGLKANIRADIVLFVNGIPLVLIECKNPTIEQVDWMDAYKQIKGYEDSAPDLFKYVQFSIATDGIKTYYFPNAFNEEGKDYLSIWKDPHPFKLKKFQGDTLKITVYGLLSKPNLIDIIGNFTFIRKENGKSTKIMARYMQFRASDRIFERVLKTLQGEEDKKFGLIWHWQGSGKTYTMAFSAWKLFHCTETERPSIFVLVDRKDLEEQIEKDFSFIGIPIEKVHRIKELIEIIKWGKEGKRGIFLVTIEKFSPKEFTQLEKQGEKLNIERENVIVLADEVHRTQYGKFATLMRSIFKNAFIFGFTGTPLSKIERNTFQKFCPKEELYLDRYSMLDALRDGFTVSLCYQARLPKHHLDKEKLEVLARFEEAEIESLSSEEKKALKRKVKVIRELAKRKERIEAIAKDIAQHFKEIVEPTELKAMIVAIDKEACVLYKNAIDQFLPPEYSEIVMTFTPKDKQIIRDYFDKLQKRYETKNVKEIHNKIIENFKTKKDPRILIVTDMLITGFDAPVLWTMYLDKSLKEHKILQAIARTNRPFLNKKFGLVVDYIGVLPELEKAFEKFEAKDAKNLRVVIRDLEQEKEKFKKLIKEILEIFEGIKREDTHESLENNLNVLIDPDVAKRFESKMKNLMKSYEMLQGDPFLADYLVDYAWLVRIYVAYCKKFKKANVDELKIEQLSKKTAALIRQTIDVKQIDDTYPTVAIDEKYIQILKKSPPKTRGAAIDIITNIQRETQKHPNSPFFINLSKEVERTYEQLRTQGKLTKEMIQKLFDFSNKIVEWKREEEKIGKEKYPIYEAVRTVLPEVGKEKVIEFVSGLLKHLKDKKLLFKGWQTQRDVRCKVRAEIRLLLLSKFKNYRKKIDELRDRVFEAMEGMK